MVRGRLQRGKIGVNFPVVRMIYHLRALTGKLTVTVNGTVRYQELELRFVFVIRRNKGGTAR